MEAAVCVKPVSGLCRVILAAGMIALELSVTVPVRRGGVLALLLPIPPATISFHGTAIVHPASWLPDSALASKLATLLPPERRNVASIIEVVPEGEFLTYGLGVTLMAMRSPAAARARVSV